MTMRALWVAAVTALTLALCIGYASAKIPEGYTPSPEESAWFKAARQQNGASCCTEQTDCRKVPAAYIRTKGANWQFKATRELYGSANGDDEWHDIPPDKIQHDRHAAENPTGEWVICWMKSLDGHVNYMGVSIGGVMCAFQPAGT